MLEQVTAGCKEQSSSCRGRSSAPYATLQPAPLLTWLQGPWGKRFPAPVFTGWLGLESLVPQWLWGGAGDAGPARAMLRWHSVLCLQRVDI